MRLARCAVRRASWSGRTRRPPPIDRWQSLGDVEAVLKWIARSAGAPHGGPPVAVDPRRKRVRAAAAAALGVASVAALALFLHSRDRAPVHGGVVAFAVHPPPGGAFTPTQSSVESAQLAVSPDGREIAFVASGADGVSQLWTRPLGSRHAQAMPGTEQATYPFWSPDGAALGFFAEKALKRIDRS